MDKYSGWAREYISDRVLFPQNTERERESKRERGGGRMRNREGESERSTERGKERRGEKKTDGEKERR